MQNTNGHQTYIPMNLLCKLRKKTTQCVDGGQHDSHEFLRHLLEIVRNEDLRVSEKAFSIKFTPRKYCTTEITLP